MCKKTIIYRGSLKSCNYKCSYCPFSKHKALSAELERDKANLKKFRESIEERAGRFSIGAVFITPYGEALIHKWYWKEMAYLSRIDEIDRVGVQTNLSFSVEECIKIFEDFGGRTEKLCIWATFHPEMTDINEFVLKCSRLDKYGVSLSVGAVGVPENIYLLRKLRNLLLKNIYLWINKMDGLKRNYTNDEIKVFSEIDYFFSNEINYPVSDAEMCRGRCFAEADGKIRSCNISRVKAVNWYDADEEEIFAPLCTKKRCSCYLAYGGRADYSLKKIFGDYPIFRIPKKFKAIFFDLEGTLIDRHKRGGFSEKVRNKLIEAGKYCHIFFATSMPYDEVIKMLKNDIEIFLGGIFASGAYLYLKDNEGIREKIYPLNIENLSDIIAFAKNMKARIRLYKKNDVVYRVTLTKGHGLLWNDEECRIMRSISENEDYRFFVEDNCLEIIRGDKNKGTGIEEICGMLGITADDVLSVGNDREDIFMEMICGGYLHKAEEENYGRKFEALPQTPQTF